MRRAKIIHDDLNAGGGSERLAFATIELLNEMKFDLDLATLHKPNSEKARKEFGGGTSNLWKFNRIELLDMSSILNLRAENENEMKATRDVSVRTDREKNMTNSKRNDVYYDLVINTHADVLPYYHGMRIYTESNQESNTDSGWSNSTIKLTYCHYPLVPQYVGQQNYSFLEKFFDSFNEFSEEKKRIIAHKVLEKFNETMKNTRVLTNSKFSKQEIERLYKKYDVVPTVIYPPVEINKFGIQNHNRNSKRHHNAILVVSRINAAKRIENAVEIGKLLKEKEKLDYYEMIIVGNMTSDDQSYLEEITNLVSEFKLREYIKLRPGIPIGELQQYMQNSSIYLHPTPDEPFGISIVEAMSAGLITVAPSNGGDAEFVPSEYQYRSPEHAAKIIAGIIKNKSGDGLANERIKLSNLTSNFSKQSFKDNLKSLIQSLLVD
jgi:glycosyltransferase involved in cell wall biosynthesis